MIYRPALSSLQPGSLPGLLEVGSFEGSERKLYSSWLLPLVAVTLIAGMAAPARQVAGVAVDRGQSEDLTVPPLPPATILKPLSREQAALYNRAIPFAAKLSDPATPFLFSGDDTARIRSEECLTAAIYYEAASESLEGQEAVAQVVLNRARHPAFPKSICGVVFQGSTLRTGCQFTFTCDGSLDRIPDRRRWAAAGAVARSALAGHIFSPVGLSTHYHADYVVPYWATSLDKTAQIGAHIFYRWRDRWGRAAAFSRRYAGSELDPDVLAAAALMRRGEWPRTLVQGAEAPVELGTDPRIELLGVLGSLTTTPDGMSAYEKDTRNFIQATGLQSTGGSGATELGVLGSRDTLNGRLRDWARQNGFSGLYAQHLRQSRKIIESAEEDAGVAANEWQTYTAMPIVPGKLTIALTARDSASRCLATDLAGGRLVFANAGSRTPGLGTDILANDGMADNLFSGPGWDPASRRALAKAAAIAPDIRGQIVRAVFARIQALSAGDAAGRRAAAQAADDGFKLVPALSLALKDFETGRTQYRTLAEFLPTLIERANLPRAAGAKGSPQSCSLPPAAQVAGVDSARSASPALGGKDSIQVAAAAGDRSSMMVIPR